MATWYRFRPVWAWVMILVIGSLVALYYLVVGLSATPMTVARADQLFQDGVRPGQTREQVESWLASQNIPPGGGRFTKNVSFDVFHRRDDVTFKGWWMDCRGNKTVAECADLDVDSVFSMVRVSYTEAEVTVYLFFDANGLLLRHWVDEFHFRL